MWTYDGEQWTDEGAGENEKKPESPMPPLQEFYPELQVIEVVPVPRTNPVPPFPLP